MGVLIYKNIMVKAIAILIVAAAVIHIIVRKVVFVWLFRCPFPPPGQTHSVRGAVVYIVKLYIYKMKKYVSDLDGRDSFPRTPPSSV
jgi:hypothetical protein